jgi:hypothetical protein
MGPLDFKMELLMQQNGPSKLPERSTNTIEWAHYILKRNCLCDKTGLYNFQEKLPN